MPVGQSVPPPNPATIIRIPAIDAPAAVVAGDGVRSDNPVAPASKSPAFKTLG